MKIEIHEIAVSEFNEAITWYEMQSRGVGKKFKKTVTEQIHKIRINPSWFLIEKDYIYKAYVPKFPYKILYTFQNDKIIIWAIAHMHRKPFYWQSRKDNNINY